MSLAEKKEVLKNLVEEADDKLIGLLIAIAEEYVSPEYDYSEDELTLFKERKEEFYKNNKEGYTVEEAHDMIRKKFNNNEL